MRGGELSPPRPTPSKAGGRRGGALQCAEAGGNEAAGNLASTALGRAKFAWSGVAPPSKAGIGEPQRIQK